MGEPQASIALLPIHPGFAEAILERRKTIEFRRASFARDVNHVAIYATAPVSKVIGVFEIASVDVDSPESLWIKYGHEGAIDEGEFRKYFKGKSVGYAIRIRKPVRLSSAIDLDSLNLSQPPQNFVYLDSSRLPFPIESRPKFGERIDRLTQAAKRVAALRRAPVHET